MALDLVVPVTSLHVFLQETTITQATRIRTLIIRIDQALPSKEGEYEGAKTAEDRIHILTHGSAGTQALWILLRNVPRVLQHMTALTTSSLVVTWSRNGFWLPMGILADIIRSYPNSAATLNSTHRVRTAWKQDALIYAKRFAMLSLVYNIFDFA
jgi:hypothetical protein